MEIVPAEVPNSTQVIGRDGLVGTVAYVGTTQFAPGKWIGENSTYQQQLSHFSFLLQVWYWKWLRARMMVLSKANPIFLAPKTTACSSVQLRSRWQLHAAEIISFWSQVCDSKQNSPGRSSKTPSRFDFISRNSCSPVSLRKYLVFFSSMPCPSYPSKPHHTKPSNNFLKGKTLHWARGGDPRHPPPQLLEGKSQTFPHPG